MSLHLNDKRKSAKVRERMEIKGITGEVTYNVSIVPLTAAHSYVLQVQQSPAITLPAASKGRSLPDLLPRLSTVEAERPFAQRPTTNEGREGEERRLKEGSVDMRTHTFTPLTRCLNFVHPSLCSVASVTILRWRRRTKEEKTEFSWGGTTLGLVNNPFGDEPERSRVELGWWKGRSASSRGENVTWE